MMKEKLEARKAQLIKEQSALKESINQALLNSAAYDGAIQEMDLLIAECEVKASE